MVEELRTVCGFATEDDVLRCALHIYHDDAMSRHGVKDDEYWETLEAVREGYEQVQAGQAIPLEQVIARVSERGQSKNNEP